MAESKGSKRYGHGPKIVPKGEASKGESVKEEKVDEGGGAAPKGKESSGTEAVNAKAEKPTEPSKETEGQTMKSGTPHEVLTHERHLAERKEMMGRHGSEMNAMHERHTKEHGDMAKRHEKELKGEAA